MNKNMLETEIKSFIEKNFPQALQEFEIVVKEQGRANINSIHVQNLVNAVYYATLQQRVDSCTILSNLVRQFARAFKDADRVETLSDLWNGKKKDSIPIPTLEAIIIRDLSNPYFRINQTYNYGHGKIYYLADLNRMLQTAKTKVMDIFNDVYLENDLQLSFNLPMFEGEKSGVLPTL